MSVVRDDVVGHRIIAVWEAREQDPTYADSFVSLDNGLTVQFSRGNLELAQPTPAFTPAIPYTTFGSGEAASCIGREIVGVVYCGGEDPTDSPELHEIHLLLKDGRYLSSSFGFNCTDLELDFFERWAERRSPQAKLRDYWDDSFFDPFGFQAGKFQ